MSVSLLLNHNCFSVFTLNRSLKTFIIHVDKQFLDLKFNPPMFSNIQQIYFVFDLHKYENKRSRVFLTTSWVVSFPFRNISLWFNKARHSWVCLELWSGFREILPIPSHDQYDHYFKNLFFAAFLLILHIHRMLHLVYRTNVMPKPCFQFPLGNL